MRADTAILLQARMASSRLPGKVLMPLAGRTVLSHCLVRLLHLGTAPVVLVTTTSTDDDPLVQEATLHGVRVVRGPEHNVLQRFLQAASELRLRVIVRATADNPAVDIDAPQRTLDALHAHRADHVCEAALPYGTAVEAVRVSALWEAVARGCAPYDCEHVTPFVRRRTDRFTALEPLAPAPIRRPDLRLTVDTLADLHWMTNVFERARAGSGVTPLVDIIRAADAVRASGGSSATEEQDVA